MKVGWTTTAMVVAAVLVAACGGDGGDGEPAPASDVEVTATGDDTVDEPIDATADDTGGDTDAGDSTADDVATDDGTGSDDASEGEGTYEPGDVSFRTVNLLDEPVDVYVRTTGFVEAFPVDAGVAPGTVTDFAAPPADGSYVVTTAGAGDPTCVIDCDHFVTDSSVQFGDGPYRTVVLYDDESDGPSALELWEQGGDPATSSNAMDAAVSGTALAIVTAVAVRDADFGLFVSTGDGCLDNVESSNIRIGGNQTVPFDFSVVNSYTVHGSDDPDCTDEPVGGPFAFDPLLADRSHVFFFGEPGDLEVLTVPFAEAGPGALRLTDDPGGDTGADAGDRDVAVAGMAAALVADVGLGDEQALCTAELIVDAVGVHVLVIDGAFVDLEDLGPDSAELAGEALLTAIDRCGLDPAALG